LAVLAVWLLIGLPWLVYPAERIEYRVEQSAQDSKAQPNGSAGSPYFVQVVPTPKSAEERADGALDREEKKSSDRWLVRWTFILSAATLGLMLATIVLGYFAHRQSKDMRASIEAAQIAASAAKKSADTVANIERPWVFISEITPAVRECPRPHYQGTSVPVQIDLSITIKNYGKTPALMETVSGQLRFSRDPPPAVLSVPPQQFLILETGKPHTFSVPVGEPLDAGIANELQSGGRRIWLHFMFTYRDISGALHETSGIWRHSLALGSWDGDYATTT
jgi:hypothetical protein